MTEYFVKIAFWLRAYDGFTVEADTDAKVRRGSQDRRQGCDEVGSASRTR